MAAELTKIKPQKRMEPRTYQLELLEYVMQRNGIIYLPTGAGKTFVAIMAIKRLSHNFENTISNGGKRAIFMCNTIELARQQTLDMRQNTNLKVGFYTGDRDVDNWSRKKWQEEIDENQVLVGTAQIFLDMVCQNFIKITDLSIVVIDECHHGTKNHPMHAFMRLFQDVTDKSQLPRVIGLTGVLIKGNKLHKIKEELQNLESTFRGNIVTVSSMEEYQNVMLFSTQPKEELVTYASTTHHFELEIILKKTINECFTVVDKWDLGTIPAKQSKNLGSVREPNKKNFIKNLMNDFLYQTEEFGLYAAAIAIMSPIIEFELKKRSAETLALRNLYRYMISKCELIRHMLISKIKDEDSDPDTAVHTLNIIFNYATPKLKTLLLYMKQKFEGKNPEDISCLIFVQRRYTAKCLYYVLKQYILAEPALQNVLRPQFMVGRNTIPPGIEMILNEKWTKKAIESFRTGEFNLLVCSNVLEEGIDIQSCNYVFAFDPLKTFNSYVQTKGRARSKSAIYAIFASKLDEMKVVEQVRGYKNAHAEIQSFLMERVLNREDPKDEAISQQFVETIPPFTSKSGARLLAVNALSTLHRYCQQLPTDAFGAATPWFTKHPLENGKGLRVSIQMPLQSTVKETIYSDVYETAKLGKISAAMKVCVKLYEEGELNERLLPVTKRECVAQVSEELFEHWKQFNDDVTFKTAGKQSRRIYERKYPDQLYNAAPQIGEECYAYEIKTTPQFELTEYGLHIAEMLNSNCSYAILTRKYMPELAEMQLFMNQGKLTAKVAKTPLTLTIKNATQMEQLRKYHLMIFRDLLECWKHFLVLDQRNLENAYLIVPMKDGKIHWELVENFQRLLPQRKYSTGERQKKIYRPEDYMGKVVNKWYSGRDNQRFVVTKVLTNMTPESRFDNDDFKSFIHFIDCRYKEEVDRIVQPKQFMLEVRELTSRRNFFINAVGKSSKLFKNNCAIHLIPELCHNFMYPGDMWLKACLLPSILHRVHFMLHAEDLRVRINGFLGKQSSSYAPLPLQIDESLLRAVDTDGNAIEEHEEQKKLLPALPTQSKELDFTVRSLSDETDWKECLEPEDFSRKPNSLFPIELDYYHKFVAGLVAELDVLKLSDENEWNQNQLDMDFTNNMNLLFISDVPLEDKRRIEILERTINPTESQTAEQREFLAAITTAGANDVFDMERFEFLGDSFLKYSVSLYLVNRYPKWHEGFLTEVKSKLVSNRNLLYCMLNTDIPNRVCGYIFKPPHEWLPPLVSLPRNLLEMLQNNVELLTSISPNDLYAIELDDDEILKGECSAEHINSVTSNRIHRNAIVGSTEEATFDNDLNLFVYKETLRDKIIADTMEAILGVCVKNYGIFETFRMLEFFNVCKPEPNQSLTHLMDLKLSSTLLHTNISTSDVDRFLINHQKLEQNLSYKFRDRAFLLQALTHPSYPTNRITGCYQELEFIGDAILDFLVSCYIFERYKHMTPGMLTDLRSALVSNITLGCICVRHRFHLFMLAENSVLAEAVKNFAAYQEKQKHRVTDQVNILMEENVVGENEEDGAMYNLSMNIDVPKALGDIVEALIAAVYLDSRDLRTTWNVIYHLLEQEFNQFSHQVPIDAVRQLCEHKHANPKFIEPIVDNGTVMVKCEFTCLDKSVEVNGFGLNSLQAKKAAAKHALKILAKCSS